MNVEAAAALNCLSSYNEIVGKLNRLWDDQLVQINNVTEVCMMMFFPLGPGEFGGPIPQVFRSLFVVLITVCCFVSLSVSLEEPGIPTGKNQEDYENR